LDRHHGACAQVTLWPALAALPQHQQRVLGPA
jgi:hypothetical protein